MRKSVKAGLAGLFAFAATTGSVMHSTAPPPAGAATAVMASASASASGSGSGSDERAFTAIMPLGDSITHGIVSTGGTPKYVAYDGYREDLWLRLRDAGIEPDFVGSCPTPEPDAFKCPQSLGDMADGQHEGHSGYRAHQLSAFIDGRLDAARPKIVLLMVGTNDLCDRCDRENAPDRLAELVAKIMHRLPDDGLLFVATIPKRLDALGGHVDAFNARVPDVVANAPHGDRVHLVPQHRVGEEAEDMSPDGLHPSACGYAKIAHVWYSTMDRHMPGDWPPGESPFEGHGACA